MPTPHFEAHPVAGANTVRLIGELDVDTVEILAVATATLATDRQVTFDLSGLTFIDSCGMHALTEHARAMDGGGPLRLANVPAFALRLFEIVGLDTYEMIEID